MSDVDGTLLRGASGIHQKVIKAAHEYIEAGGLLSLSTGRSLVSSRWAAQKLKVNIPCILYTGSVIYDFDTEQCIWSRCFDSDIIQILEQLYIEYPEISIQVYTLDNIFMLRSNGRLLSKGIKEEIPDRISQLADIHGDPLKLLLSCDDVETLHKCKEHLFSSDKVIFSFSSTHFAEVVAEGAGKDNAMKRLSEMYDVQLSSFFSAGDGMTDLPMMELSGYSFAPVTAPKTLLDSCDMIIPSPKEVGMEIAFNYARNNIKSV